MSENIIDKTHGWFIASGQMSGDYKLHPANLCLYIGLQLEEMSEKLSLLGFEDMADMLDHEARQFKEKNTHYFGKVAAAANSEGVDLLPEILDADLDLIWVTIGAAYSLGADVSSAYNEVARANWAKFPDGVPIRHPVTNKVMKPEGWKEPNVAQFIEGRGYHGAK